jgi:hypothetical protein
MNIEDEVFIFFSGNMDERFHGKTKISHDPSIELNLQ